MWWYREQGTTNQPFGLLLLLCRFIFVDSSLVLHSIFSARRTGYYLLPYFEMHLILVRAQLQNITQLARLEFEE